MGTTQIGQVYYPLRLCFYLFEMIFYKWRSRNTCRLLIFNCPNRCARQMKRCVRTSYERANIHTNHLPKAFETTDHHQSSHLWLNSFFLFSIRRKQKKNQRATSFAAHTRITSPCIHTFYFIRVDYLSRSIEYTFVYLLDSVQKAKHTNNKNRNNNKNVHALVWQ